MSRNITDIGRSLCNLAVGSRDARMLESAHQSLLLFQNFFVKEIILSLLSAKLSNYLRMQHAKDIASFSRT
jgi:hypothetical protein